MKKFVACVAGFNSVVGFYFMNLKKCSSKYQVQSHAVILQWNNYRMRNLVLYASKSQVLGFIDSLVSYFVPSMWIRPEGETNNECTCSKIIGSLALIFCFWTEQTKCNINRCNVKENAVVWTIIKYCLKVCDKYVWPNQYVKHLVAEKLFINSAITIVSPCPGKLFYNDVGSHVV